ncbi:uncharacterized protein [Aegilops tauschii subsp. strangulata]|uniref:uncharacterized protein n=1 Tax=Aegilops tauschii subsp. strangulata TaxID=200361 RepID=UPI003CC8C8DB
MLDSIPTYAMATMRLPPAVVVALDKLRRAFLWSVADRAPGAQYRVFRSKAEGGLGVRALEHWRALRKLLPIYRGLTRVHVGGGATTSFWHDWLLPYGVPSAAFPTLFTHAVRSEDTVACARQVGVRALLVPRLTHLVARDCVEVQELMASMVWAPRADARLTPLCRAPKGAFSARAAYRLARFGGTKASNSVFLWSSPAPSRVKFFCWLLTMARVHTRDVLLRKTILTAAEAGCPCCHAALDTADHLIFGCPFVVCFWTRLGLSPAGASVASLHQFDASPAVGVALPSAFVMLCCWRLWKRRNEIVFRNNAQSLVTTLKCCRDDADLWRVRFQHDQRPHVDVWLGVLASS